MARRQCRLAIGAFALFAFVGWRPLSAQQCVALADSVYRRGDAVRRAADKSVVLRVPRLTLGNTCMQWASDSAAQFMGSFDRYRRRSVWELYVASAAGIVAFVMVTEGRDRAAIAIGVPALLLTLHANHSWGQATTSLDDAIRAHNAAVRSWGR
jgi:hypothetical protein